MSTTGNGLEDIVTRQDACRILGVTPKTLQNYERQGQLKAMKLGAGRLVRYFRSDLMSLIKPKVVK